MTLKISPVFIEKIMFPAIRSTLRHVELSRPLYRPAPLPNLVRGHPFISMRPARSMVSRSVEIQNRHVPFPDGIQAKWMDTIPHMRMAKSGYLEPYWRVARAMQHKGLLPLVHGQSQIFRVCHEVLKALGFRNGELLRIPSPDFFAQSKEAMAKLSHYQTKTNNLFYRTIHQFPTSYISPELAGRLDHMSQFSPFLLSTTLGLGGIEATIDDGFTWGRAYDEFGLSFVFGQPAHKFDTDTRGNRSRSDSDSIQTANKMVRAAMELKGYSDDKIEDVLEKLQGLYEQAKELEYGQLLIVGMPSDKASEWTYASRRYGVATGRQMLEVMDDLSQGISPKKAGQVRLLLTEVSLHPVTGVSVVNLMDESEVESFCMGIPMKPLSEEQDLQTILDRSKDTVQLDRGPLEAFQRKLRNTIAEILR